MAIIYSRLFNTCFQKAPKQFCCCQCCPLYQEKIKNYICPLSKDEKVTMKFKPKENTTTSDEINVDYFFKGPFAFKRNIKK